MIVMIHFFLFWPILLIEYVKTDKNVTIIAQCSHISNRYVHQPQKISVRRKHNIFDAPKWYENLFYLLYYSTE